jgi:NAD(P)H-dependent FMN reductase
MSHFLFLVASTREPGITGNTEWLARRAAQSLGPRAGQTWLSLPSLDLPAFVDRRHTVGEYPMPEGDLRRALDAMLAATDIVFVSPVYWYSLPAPLKVFLDHWSAFLRVPGLDFKARMASKPLRLVTTSGDRAKAQPSIDSVRLCAEFMGMPWGGALWGKGGAPDAVVNDEAACAAALSFLQPPPR